MSGLRLALTLLTVLPAGAPHPDRGSARTAVLAAPAVGVLLGALAALVAAAALRLGLAPLVAGVLGVGTLAVLTRGLHLDGLADLADGLGSRRPAAGALEVMRRSDVGPFGVATLVLVLLLQCAAVSQLGQEALVAQYAGTGVPAVLTLAAGLATAAATGRAAVSVACRRGVPAARPDGLGALLAGVVPRASAGVVALVVVAAAAAAGQLVGLGALRTCGAVLAGLAAALLLERHAVRRLGGVTGDVLGALVETATTAALLVLAATPLP